MYGAFLPLNIDGMVILLADRFVVGYDGFSCAPFSRDGGEGSGANLLPVVPSGGTPGAVIDIALHSRIPKVRYRYRAAGLRAAIVKSLKAENTAAGSYMQVFLCAALGSFF